MATKLGTAFVDVQPDFSAFDRLVAQKLGRSFADAGEQSGRDFSKGFDKQGSGILVPISRALRDIGTDANGAGVSTKKFGSDTAKAAKVAQVGVKKLGEEIAKTVDIPAPKIAVPDIGVPALAFDTSDRSGTLDLKIGGANAKLEQLSAKINELTSRPHDVDVRGEIADAIAKFESVKRARDKLVDERASLITVRVNTGDIDTRIAKTDAEVERLRAHLATLAARPQTIEVQAQTTQAIAELARVEAAKRALTATKAKIDVEVDRTLGDTFRELIDGAGGLKTLGDATTRVSLGFLSFGASLTPLVGLIAAAAVAIGVSLVGALAALVSSLALAAAGAAALGVALGGILGVSLGLLIPVGIRLGKVFESLKADNAATDAIGRNAAAGSQAAASAANAQAAAQRGLTEATRQLGVSSKAAYREMADAAEAASDAIRGVANAQLSLDQAKLSTEQAELELAKYRAELDATGAAFGAVFEKFTDVSVDTSGLRKAISDASAASGQDIDSGQELELRQKILDVRAARLREKEAIDGVSDAQRTATRTQERHNEFVKQGRLASEGYRSALRGVESATLAVAAANAQQGVGVAAQEKAAQLAGRLTKAEARLKETIQDVGKALRGAFTPATDAVITGLTTGLSRMPQLVNPLRSSIGRLGEAWRESIETFSADLIRPDSISKMQAFTDAAATLAGPITRGISAFLDILTDIGRAALPHLISGTEKVADTLERWAKGTANATKLDKTIANLVSHTKTWLGVGVAIADVFVAFFIDAAGPGQSLAETIKSIAERTADWLRSDAGREAVKQFFKDTIGLAKRMVGFFADLIAATTKFGQKASPILDDVFEGLGDVVDAVKGAVHWFGKHDTVATALLATLGGFAAALAAYTIGTTAATVGTALLAGSVSVLTAALFANPIGLITLAIVGIGTALVIAYKRSETFRRVVGAAVDFVKEHWRALLIALTGPFGLAVVQIVDHFGTIKAVAKAVIGFITDHWKTLFVVLTGPIGLAAAAIAKSFDVIKDAARTALRILLGAIDKIAGGFSTMLSVLSHVPGFGWAKTAAKNIDGAREALRSLSKSLDDVPADKKVRLHLALTDESRKALAALNKLGNSVGGPEGTGRTTIRRAMGGIVPGFGTGDTVPAWLTPREFVTRASIVASIGAGVFADINEGRLDPRVGYEAGQRPSVGPIRATGPQFASGGFVGAREQAPAQRIAPTFPITVAGGGPPDPLDLAVKTSRAIEARYGGGVGQD